MENTTLELVLQAAGGRVAVPEADAATMLGLAYQTLANHRSNGLEIIKTFLIGRRRYVYIGDIADIIEIARGGPLLRADQHIRATATAKTSTASLGLSAKGRRGRPRKAAATRLG